MKGFVGIHSKDQLTANGGESEPPDQGLAVNNNVAAEINNSVLRFFNAATGAPLTAPISLFALFGISPTTDPQAFFDQTTGRWFFTASDAILASPLGEGAPFAGLEIAVSTTSDPLGSYFIYRVVPFSADLQGCLTQPPPSLDCAPDYPHAGYDANGFYISVNLFNVATGRFAAAATYALPKSKLEAGASFAYARIVYPGDFVVQPSVPAPGEPFETAANGTEYLMEARNILDQSHNIRVWAISNTNNIVSKPSSLRAFAVDVAGENYGLVVPATEPDVIGPLCKSRGAFAAPFLDGVHNSFQATVQKAKGMLYGALPFGSVDGNGLLRDSVAWFALKPSMDSADHPSASIFRQGYVVPSNGYSILNPAFGLDKSGAGFLGFTITNKSKTVPGGFPSAGLIQFTGTGTTGRIIVSGQGITSDDGFTGCPAGVPFVGAVGRWGDYGAATVDAATGFFYTANENISGARGFFTNWGTFITQVQTSLSSASARP